MPDATTNLAVLVADTSFVNALNDVVIAEETAATTQLQPAVAATIPLQPTVEVAVAALREKLTALDALLSGSNYQVVSASVAIAEARQAASDLSVALAEAYALTPALDISITDAIAIVLEPNEPKAAPLVSMTDLTLGIHPNVFTSPTTDFSALGVSSADVLEVFDGPNVGNYVIQQVEGSSVFVGEAPISPTATGPWSGEVRVHRNIIAQGTAALVIDQALFFAPTVRFVTLDMAVV